MQTTTLSVRSSKTGAGLMPSTRTNSSMTSLARPPLEYLRKILLYSLLCLIAKTPLRTRVSDSQFSIAS
ncbi:hypothetical protein GN958_ATG19938 [Phytophthora infestans]|uniref:Uncharacterized protein n=1 Tax=Phytophthora infestans TaxID=4787 RepID=A0A8S9TSI8_PHYIN|nr:hypothetical protein GN958_ATG19938 [Phytophthora infestans]